MDLKERSDKLELMDDLQISGDVVIRTLKELDTINRLLGGNAISLKPFKKLASKEKSFTLVDLGCGSGEILKTMAKWCRKKGYDGKFIGIDANPNITEYARENCTDFSEIEIRNENIFEDGFRNQRFDIIHCCLFNHHFDNHTNATLFKQFRAMAKHVIINDLQRHQIAYTSIKLLTSIFSKSEMVKYDGKLSVARAFRRSDIREIFAEAEIDQYSLSWKWAFRWRMVF